jgi:aminoglycoside phosphotransferase (APT) family kinase protein
VADDGSTTWVARMPIPHSGRTINYDTEALIGRLLLQQGCPVAAWTTVAVTGVPCSVAPLLRGEPIDDRVAWTAEFAGAVARTLRTLHDLPVDGHGPLRNSPAILAGQSSDDVAGIVERWWQAPIWPFDGSDLARHTIARLAPDLVDQLGGLDAEIRAATAGCAGLVHSDLHGEHLLRSPDWTLTAVLDFGDAFAGSVAWDFALLRWYYGDEPTALVANAYGANGRDLAERGRTLAVAVGLYKLAKYDGDLATLARIRRLIDHRR